MTPHGTASRYKNERCRCEPCTLANRERCYRTFDDLHTRPLNEVPHGTVSGYRNWGCRCLDCTRVHSAACRAYRQKRRAAS